MECPMRESPMGNLHGESPIGGSLCGRIPHGTPRLEIHQGIPRFPMRESSHGGIPMGLLYGYKAACHLIGNGFFNIFFSFFFVKPKLASGVVPKTAPRPCHHFPARPPTNRGRNDPRNDPRVFSRHFFETFICRPLVGFPAQMATPISSATSSPYILTWLKYLLASYLSKYWPLLFWARKVLKRHMARTIPHAADPRAVGGYAFLVCRDQL